MQCGTVFLFLFFLGGGLTKLSTNHIIQNGTIARLVSRVDGSCVLLLTLKSVQQRHLVAVSAYFELTYIITTITLSPGKCLRPCLCYLLVGFKAVTTTAKILSLLSLTVLSANSHLIGNVLINIH